MRKFLSVILILCLVFASAVPAFAADASGASLELVKYKGKVTVTTSAGKNVELKSDKGTKLVSGYTVKTGAASYAYISLDQTQAVKMDASTTVTIDQNGKKLDINLVSGTLSYDVKAPLKKDQSTTVSTSNSITGIRGTFGLVRTFFDITLGRQISTTILFEGHSKVSTLGNNGSVVSTKDVFASNLLESIENVARLSQMTKEDFAGFIAIELAEDPALLSRVEKALAESGNPEAAAIDVREIAANAEEILAAEEKQAEEDAKALEAELAAQKAEQDRLEAAAKTDKLDGQDDAVQLFDGEAATDPATDAVSAEDAENTSGDSGSGGSSGGNNGNPNYDNTFDPASINDLDDAFTQANAAAAQGKTSVINAPAGQYNNPINLGQGVTLNAQDGFVPTEPVTLNGGKLTGTMNAPSSTINVNGTGSEISGNITAGTLNVGSGGGLNVATGSTLNTTALDVSGGSMTNNGSISSRSVRVTNGELTNKNSVSADESLTVSGGTYDSTSGATSTGGNVSVTGNGTLKGNSANKITINGGNDQNPNSITIGSSTNTDAPTFTGGVVLENNAVMNMNNGNFSGGVQVNGCTVNVNGGTINSITGNSNDARIIINGGAVTGGITGTFDKVTLSRGTVTGGINLTKGGVEVTAGTISGGTYGIKTTSNITVNGGNISGTSYGIYASGDALGVLIEGGDISGATGVYLNAPTTGGGSTVYAFGGTITAGAGDGILLDGRANLELGQANSQTSCSIISTGGHGINGANTISSSSLTTGSVKTSASDKYALNSSNFTLRANSSVLVSAPAGRLASDSDYLFSSTADANGYYTLQALTGGNSGSVTVTSYSDLDTAFTNAEAGTGPTTIIVGGTNEITEGDRTVGPGITLVAASNYKPSKLTLTGGTLQGTLNNPGTNGTTIETSGTSQNPTTSTIDGTFAVKEFNVGTDSTLEIATSAAISSGTLIVSGNGAIAKNYARLSTQISLLDYGQMYNYGSISLSGEHLALSSNSKLYSQNGSISIGGTTGGSTGTLNLSGTSYIYGTVNMEGDSEANLYDSSIITNDTDTAALTASGNAIINVISGTISNTNSNGGTALSLTGETTATIGDVGGVSSIKGTAIEFAGKSLKVSGNSSSVSGTVGIAADRSTASDFGKISLLSGYITGTAGDGISIGENISVELGEFSTSDPYVSGNATVTGHTNGIEITSTGSAFCYLLSGSVESKSSTDYALNGTYGGVAPYMSQGTDSRFYLGEVNRDTGAQIATYNNNSVRLKTAAAVAAGTPDITHLIYNQDGTGSAKFAQDANDTTWYFLQYNTTP